MAERTVELRYFPIGVDSLLDNLQASFDVYTLVEVAPETACTEDFVVYAKAPYRWTSRELNDLMKYGVHELYVENSQRNLFLRYQEMKNVRKPEIDESLAPAFRLQQIQDVSGHLLQAAMLSAMNPTLFSYMSSVAACLVRCLKEDPSIVTRIQTLGEHSLYTYIHSAGVSVLMPAVALQLGETDELALAEFAMSGLLHDVGKKRVALSILDKTGPLRPEEWDIMRSHPSFGIEELANCGASSLVLDVVGNHHEKLDGSGYPNGLSGSQIPEWVQIATVADIFSALTTSRCYHFKRSRYQALMFMKHELAGKISKDAFNALVRSLVVESEE